MQYNGNGGLFSGTLTQLFAATSGTLFAISDGMSYGWTAPMIPYLISEDSHIKTTKYEAEWLETILMLGSLFGLPITIYLVDKIGRKKSMLLAAFVSFVCWLTIALATRMSYIFVARFFFGVAGNMSFVAAPMYVAEISDQKIRGFLSSIIYMMMLVGFLIVYSVGPFCPFYVIPVIGCVVLFTDLVLFSTMPESPYYLLYKDKISEARASLEYLRPDRNIDDELGDITKAILRQKSETGRIQDLILVDSNRKAVLIMLVLNAGQHLCAISVILMNLHLILEAGDSIYMDPAVIAIIFAVIMLISTKIASLQVDRFGRKALLVISTIISGVCLLVLAVYFNLKLAGYDLERASWIPMVAVLVYAAGFKFGLGIVPIVITAEIFSAKMKAIGMTLADAWYFLGSIVSLQLYQWLSQSYGIHVPFYLFSFCAFLVCFFTVVYIPETKGKTLEEIQMLLKGPCHDKVDYRKHGYHTFDEVYC